MKFDLREKKFRLIDRPIVDDPFVTTEKPTRESDNWTLILSLKDNIRVPIIRDGYWYEWNPDSTEEDKYETTGVKSRRGIKGDGVQQKFLSSMKNP